MKYWIILSTLITLLSCKEKNIEKFYYPNKTDFEKFSENSPELKISNFRNFKELIDTLEILNSRNRKAVFRLKEKNKEFYFTASTFFSKDLMPPRIKFFNILSVSKDSILKKDTYYTTDKLNTVFKKDILNYGKDENYSKSPRKLVISITENIENLENLILRVFKEFNKIQSQQTDSLYLTINFNERLKIIPPIPEIKK